MRPEAASRATRAIIAAVDPLQPFAIGLLSSVPFFQINSSWANAMVQLGDWRFILDRDATAAAYARAPAGYAATCTCCWCRNFLLVRDKIFPRDFLALLDSLGIDASKDAEVYNEGRQSPASLFYGGWYHFVGELEVTGDFAPLRFGENLIAYLCKSYAPRLEALQDRPLVQLEFRAENVPWELDESQPE